MKKSTYFLYIDFIFMFIFRALLQRHLWKKRAGVLEVVIRTIHSVRPAGLPWSVDSTSLVTPSTPGHTFCTVQQGCKLDFSSSSAEHDCAVATISSLTPSTPGHAPLSVPSSSAEHGCALDSSADIMEDFNLEFFLRWWPHNFSAESSRFEWNTDNPPRAQHHTQISPTGWRDVQTPKRYCPIVESITPRSKEGFQKYKKIQILNAFATGPFLSLLCHPIPRKHCFLMKMFIHI